MIKDMTKFTESIWNWDILKGCFSATRTAPMDLDGIIERKGRFLVFETKSINSQVSKGQEITFNSLAKTGLFTIIVIWGARGSPQEIQVIYPGGKKTERQKSSLEELRRIVASWYAYADQKIKGK